MKPLNSICAECQSNLFEDGSGKAVCRYCQQQGDYREHVGIMQRKIAALEEQVKATKRAHYFRFAGSYADQDVCRAITALGPRLISVSHHDRVICIFYWGPERSFEEMT